MAQEVISYLKNGSMIAVTEHSPNPILVLSPQPARLPRAEIGTNSRFSDPM